MPIGSMPLRSVCAAAMLVGLLTPAAAQFPDLRSLFTPNPTDRRGASRPRRRPSGAARPARPAIR